MLKNLPKKNCLSFPVVLFTSLFFFSLSTISAKAATLSITPATGSFSGIIEATISLDPQGSSVSGVDAIVKYEPDKLEAQLIQNGVFEQYLKKNINKTTGTIEISSYNTTTLVTSTAVVAKISFKPLVASGTSAISFVFTPTAQGGTPATGDSNVASGGSDVLSGATGATYTLLASGGTTTTTTTGTPATTTPTTTPAVPATGDSTTTIALSLLSLSFIFLGFYLLNRRTCNYSA